MVTTGDQSSGRRGYGSSKTQDPLDIGMDATVEVSLSGHAASSRQVYRLLLSPFLYLFYSFNHSFIYIERLCTTHSMNQA